MAQTPVLVTLPVAWGCSSGLDAAFLLQHFSSPWLQVAIKSHFPEVFQPLLWLHRALRCWSPSQTSATPLRPNSRLGRGEPLSGQRRCPTQPPWRAVTPRKATHVLHGLVKYAWHRPCASKDNTTAAWQILDIKRTMQIKYEDTRILCWSKVKHWTYILLE